MRQMLNLKYETSEAASVALHKLFAMSREKFPCAVEINMFQIAGVCGYLSVQKKVAIEKGMDVSSFPKVFISSPLSDPDCLISDAKYLLENGAEMITVNSLLGPDRIKGLIAELSDRAKVFGTLPRSTDSVGFDFLANAVRFWADELIYAGASGVLAQDYTQISHLHWKHILSLERIVPYKGGYPEVNKTVAGSIVSFIPKHFFK